MIWFFVLLIVVALAAVIAAGLLGARPSFPARTAAVVLAVALLAAGAALFWKHTVIALAIASVCSLAVGVMFTRIAPGKAFAGALAAFVLMFGGPWLALQLSSPLLFDRESDLTRWAGAAWGALTTGEWNFPTAKLAVSIAFLGLLAASLFGPRVRALAILVGGNLLLFFGPRVMEELGLYHPGMHSGIDPLLAALITVAVVLGVVGLLQRLSDNSNHNNP